jgi:hypothetical protein
MGSGDFVIYFMYCRDTDDSFSNDETVIVINSDDEYER